MTYVEPTMPSFETIAKLTPIADIETLSIRALLQELNRRIEEHVQFGEYGFSTSFMVSEEDAEAPLRPYRWLEVSAVRGSNEGFYIHIRHCLSAPRNGVPVTELLTVAKTWRWAEALAIAAIATRLLQDW